MQQLGLEFRGKNTRGGARNGAGRKRLPASARHTPHRARAEHRARHPVHVTLRAFTHSLRSQYVVGVVLRALHQSNSSRFRVVHHSVQANHLHLLVEAENKGALSSGMRSLVIRIARRVNQVLFRRGRFWADRWHGSALTSPRQVRELGAIFPAPGGASSGLRLSGVAHRGGARRRSSPFKPLATDASPKSS